MNGIGTKRKNVGGIVVLKFVIVMELPLIVKETKKTKLLKIVVNLVLMELKTQVNNQLFRYLLLELMEQLEQQQLVLHMLIEKLNNFIKSKQYQE